MILYFLNKEFCTEDIINSILRDYDYDNLERVEYYLNNYTTDTFLWADENFQFNKYMIEQDKANFLTNVQEAAIKCNPELNNYVSDFTQINQLIDEYFYNKGAKVSYGCDLMTDLIMSDLAAVSVNRYENERNDYDYLCTIARESKRKVISIMDELYNKVHSKELTK